MQTSAFFFFFFYKRLAGWLPFGDQGAKRLSSSINIVLPYGGINLNLFIWITAWLMKHVSTQNDYNMFDLMLSLSFPY